MDFDYRFALEGGWAALAGDFEMASLLLEKAAGVRPDRSNYWTVLGNIALAWERPDDAASHYARSLRADENDLLAYLGLIAAGLQRRGNSPEAMDALEGDIAAFGRLDHVDALETVFLTAVVRADWQTISVFLETMDDGSRWDKFKHGAISHLISRYFPFGLGLETVVRHLPHLSINNLFTALFDVQRRDLEAWAAGESKRIAVVNSQPKNLYNDHPIFGAIVAAGHDAAYFMAQVSTSRELVRSGMSLDRTYLIFGSNLAECDVDLLFSTSPQAAHFAANAAKVLIPHDIAGHPRASEADGPGIVPMPDYTLFDYFLTTNDRMARDLGDFIVENEAVLDSTGDNSAGNRQRSVRRLVPSGYSKLDYNIDRVQSLKAVSGDPVILVYPTDFTIHPGGMTPDVARPVIEMLLREFPEHRVVYRPHPNNTAENGGPLQEVRALFGSEPRFEFNDDTNYLALWARTSVMVTDFSGGAMTFACTTGRPTVFFNPVDASAQRADRGGIIEYTDQLGITVTKAGAVATAIRQLLDPAAGWSERIAAFGRTAVYNPGGAAAYIASVIPQLLTDETPDGWTAL